MQPWAVLVLCLCLVAGADLQDTENFKNDCDEIAEEELTNTNLKEDPDPLEEVAPQGNELEVQEDVDLEQVCPELSGQIIGGRATSIRRYPYQVSMVINGNSFCGGFIISPNFVLTAAHCVRNTAPERIRLRAGSSWRDAGGVEARVAGVAVHPRYGRPRLDNDVAVLRLARALPLSRTVRALRLPRASQPVPLAQLTVTGWGLTAARGRRIPLRLRAARVPAVPHWLCRLSYGAALTDNMFCGGHFLIGGISSCQGDSGGPAVFRGTALGVVSFARGCALPLSPTVFTRLAAPPVRAWIANVTGI